MERNTEESYASVRTHAKLLRQQLRVWVKSAQAEGMNGVHAYINGVADQPHVLDMLAKLEDRSEMDKRTNMYTFTWIAVTTGKAPFGTLSAREERARPYLRQWRTYQNWCQDHRVTIAARNRKRLTTARLHHLYYKLKIEKN